MVVRVHTQCMQALTNALAHVVSQTHPEGCSQSTLIKRISPPVDVLSSARQRHSQVPWSMYITGTDTLVLPPDTIRQSFSSLKSGLNKGRCARLLQPHTVSRATFTCLKLL